jgi:protein involved in polysaccharide export with SLBB domain
LAARRFITAAAIVAIVAISPFVTISLAQQSDGNIDRVTDLAAQNLSRVSASPAEIKSVLLKDAGLLVELKRWVAKDATSHGQIVSDSDLTNDAIFDRLETDVQFRSVATAMLQRFGYLLPKLNPDSDAAKDRELLVQERTKWIAQRQEEDLAQARQRNPRVQQELGSCDPPNDQDCNPQARSMPASDPIQGSPQNDQDRNTPGPPNPRNSPDNTGNPNMRAQLIQTGDNFTSESDEFRSADPNGISIASSNYGSNMLENLSTESMQPSSNKATRPQDPGANQDASDGLLAAYGNGMGINTQSGTSMDSGRSLGRETNSSTLRANSQRLPMQPTYQRPAAAVLPQPPDMLRKQSPYSDIPSLYDMYVQAVMRPVNPKRFGADIFENGTRDSRLIPMDLPVGPEYVVGPGDALSVDLWGGISQRLNRVVDREGRVSLPEVGPILVSGKSLATVQQTVQQILRTQFQDVSAEVSLARLRTIRVYEVGDLTHPGAYDISSLSTPLNALFAGGGPTARGSMRIVKHFRGTQLIQTVDVYDLLLHGVKIDLQRLENGDMVQVPPIGPQVTVEGMVRRPAVYELRDEKTLASVLELAGGLLPTAALRHPNNLKPLHS